MARILQSDNKQHVTLRRTKDGPWSLTTELEQWNANIAFAQVNLSPLADHKPGNWLFPV